MNIKWRHLIRGAFVGFLISIFVSLLAFLGHFRPYENPFTAAMQYSFTKKAGDIALLFITDQEYKKGFNGTSPLSRKRLSQIIDQLVSLKAKVIALDIDVSDQTEEDSDLLNSFRRASDKNVRIVLPAILNTDTGNKKDENEKNTGFLRPYSVVEDLKNSEGYEIYNAPSLLQEFQEISLFGGSVFSVDNDGIFRTAKAFYLIDNEQVDGPLSYPVVPSFPLAIAAAYKGISQEKLVDALKSSINHTIAISVNDDGAQIEPISFHYGKDGKITPTLIGNYEYFDRDVEIDQLLTDGNKKNSGTKTIFADKIVLLGGTYDKRDFYYTPLGKMSGMEINANITQSILNGTLISHLSLWKAFVVEVLIGFVVACIFVFSSSALRASIICTISVMPVIVGASILTFATSYYWFDFFPIYAGVMLHGIISKIEEKHHRVSNAQ